jgi:proteasome lid subunit RPN8/RPN11
MSPASASGATLHHADAQADDFEVYFQASVLEEATALTKNAGDLETGGILVGHLGHEPRSPGLGIPDLCVAITALIPARHTVGHSTKLTFTSDTWTDVRRALELRGLGEVVLGWFHSHPQLAWCREKGCSAEAQKHCELAAGFFSADDVALHRTMFPRAFTVALLMTHSGRGILPRLFGWRAGLMEPRGFQIVHLPITVARHVPTGGTSDATPALA